MTPPQSHATGRIFVVDTVPQKTLILQLQVDCPVCGKQTIEIQGHHLRALRETVRIAFDTFPELLGEDTGLWVIDQTTFTGGPPRDPSTN